MISGQHVMHHVHDNTVDSNGTVGLENSCLFKLVFRRFTKLYSYASIIYLRQNSEAIH